MPTRELANQVNKAFTSLSVFCSRDIQTVNLTPQIHDEAQRALLASSPDIIVTTPARALHHINGGALSVEHVTHIVIDEADLVLSYGYNDDFQRIVRVLPSGIQTFLASATLTPETDTLKNLFCRDPVLVSPDHAEKTSNTLSQYVVRCAEDDKFLMLFAIFKLKLIQGKSIIFVGDVDRCYRLKLFLEQFGIRSCVLNSELPVNSRIHVVEEFNKNVYEIVIATDETDLSVNDEEGVKALNVKSKHTENSQDEDENPQDNSQPEPRELKGKSEDADPQPSSKKKEKKKKDDNDKPNATPQDRENPPKNPKKAQGSSHPERTQPHTQDSNGIHDPQPRPKKQKREDPRKRRDYGISRGIDFHHVSLVLNFDLPATATSYTHRIGRTARAGRPGVALSFVIPPNEFHKHKTLSFPLTQHDETVLESIATSQAEKDLKLEPYSFDLKKLEGFKYRVESALKAVTPGAIKQARLGELRREILGSERLKRWMEENPEEGRWLRHDLEVRSARVQPHLRHVPEYLMPSGAKGAGEQGLEKIGLVGMGRQSENRIRRARERNRMKGKGKARRKVDPLKSFSAAKKGRK